MNKVFKVGLIGCGHIAETYFRAHKYFNNFKIIKCADILNSASKKCALKYGIENLSVNEILKDKEIEIILNLTIPKAHYEVAKKALLHNKHVYSEKPMAINLKDGKELLKLAKKRKLYIGNAPDTFLGGGNQKSKELLEKNLIGKINLGNAIFAFPGVQSYHPNPEPWFAKKEGGPVIDMGPYYLTALVKLLGPVTQVSSYSEKNFNKRLVDNPEVKYEEIEVEVDTHFVSLLKFKSGVVVDFQVSFDIWKPYDGKLEIYGENSSLKFADPNNYDGEISIFNKETYQWQNIYTSKDSENNYYRGLGVVEMVNSIKENSVSEDDLFLPFHVLNIMCTLESYDLDGNWAKISEQF